MKLRPLLDNETGRDALERLCKPEGLDSQVATRLVEAVQGQAGRTRRRGLFDQFDRILAAGEE